MIAQASGHGALSFPKPRNAIDGNLFPWSNWSFPCDTSHSGSNCAITFCEDGKNCQGSCPISAHNGVIDALNASNGQACYWFSNGCCIGCGHCDGTHNHVGHGLQKFLYKGMRQVDLLKHNITIPNPFNPPHNDMLLDPKTRKTLNIQPNCAAKTAATVCDSNLRTANTQADCGGPEDFYYFSPWRAPGSAPVIDACGSAGGRFPGQGVGGAGAQFQNSSVAKAGDFGSQLPSMTSQATWARGSIVEVGWTLMANHGGGYSYRLAPADSPLTEETFRKLPLDFDGDSILRWGGDTSTQVKFDSDARGWQTSSGTVPAGSMWRKNPIPSGLWEREGSAFNPVCEESDACIRSYSAGGAEQGTCKCSGFSNSGPLLPNLEIIDSIKIPKTLSMGRYVLQWRWDCEESNQVWASCSDVTLTA